MRTPEMMEDGHDETLRKTNRLREVLTHLRYEGRPSLGKNLKEAREVLGFFKRELVDHVEREEKIDFPFLEAHLPKLQPALLLLRSEHEDFRKNLERFQSWLTELSRKRNNSNYAKIVEKVKEAGTYLTYLLQNHLQVEEVVYKIANRDLRLREKKELLRLRGKGPLSL